MGHKVSPVSFRIPYIKPWSATWYSDKWTYAANLWVDNAIRSLLKKELSWIPYWDIIISRNQDKIVVTIYTTKVALVLWKEWENLSKIESILSKKARNNVSISVKEIKKPDLNAKIVWYMVSNQIEKRMPYKRAIKQAIAKTIEKWAKWIKIKVWGRLNWAEIARKETFKEGNIPTQTIRADIDYCSVRSETVYWTIGLKVWIYKWDVFNRK
jgi:small subunit ribosomal protein S3